MKSTSKNIPIYPYTFIQLIWARLEPRTQHLISTSSNTVPMPSCKSSTLTKFSCLALHTLEQHIFPRMRKARRYARFLRRRNKKIRKEQAARAEAARQGACFEALPVDLLHESDTGAGDGEGARADPGGTAETITANVPASPTSSTVTTLFSSNSSSAGSDSSASSISSEDPERSKATPVNENMLKVLNQCPETEKPIEYLIVHVLRHEEAKHRIVPEDETIFDPHLTTQGYINCCKIRKEMAGKISPDLILASPLTRTLSTAWRVFSPSPTQREIWAWPNLQNYDPGPNGTGLGLDELRKRCQSKSNRGFEVRLDYVPWDWYDKETGIWSDDNPEDRVEAIKDFLVDLMEACPKRKFEVALVTHGSISMDLFGDGNWWAKKPDPYRKSLVFDPLDRSFWPLSDDDVKESREAAARKVRSI